MSNSPKTPIPWSKAVPPGLAQPIIIVVMGVSGSGKTTVSALLAAAFGWNFQEGDALHPTANVEKMRSGTPLADADRLPWLRKIAEEIDRWRDKGESGVVTCSARNDHIGRSSSAIAQASGWSI